MFGMKILDLKKNDSGIYYCGLISFSFNQTLVESKKSNLTVSEKIPQPLDDKETEVKEGEDRDPDKKAQPKILLPAIAGLGLLLVLACSCGFLVHIIRRKQERGKLENENVPLEEEVPSPVAIFTVDYGELEFHVREEAARRAPPPPSPQRPPQDQTEYATIVFSQEKLAPDDRDMRTKGPRVSPGRARLQGMRFKCSNCSRSWRSAQTVVVFHLLLRHSPGLVKMRVFGQKCDRCRSSKYEEPSFQDDTVRFALHNLVRKILNKCYREPGDLPPLPPPVPEDHLEGPHKSEDCEACKHGFCLQRRMPASVGPSVQPERISFQSSTFPLPRMQEANGESFEEMVCLAVAVVVLVALLFFFGGR